MMKIKTNFKYLAFALVLALFNNISAEAEVEKKLSLKECIEITLKNNLDLKIEKFNPELKQLNLKKNLDEYSLYFSFQPNIKQNNKPSSNSFITGASLLNELSQNYDFSFNQKFLTGANLAFNFDNSIFFTNSTRVDINPSITPRLTLAFSQPLLKNAFSGYRKIELAENETETANLKLKNRIIELISKVNNNYWDIVLTKERLKVLEKSLDLAKELLKINKEKEKAGFLAKIDILSTEANIASKEENILQVKRDLGNREDRLKILLNDNNITWKTELKIDEKPYFSKMNVDIDKIYEDALKNRVDYLLARLELKSFLIEKTLAEQNKLPQLNLAGNTGLESLDNNYFNSLNKLLSFKTYFWNIGFSFEVPVTGNIYETQYKESLLNYQKQEVTLKNLESNLYLESREAVRNLQINEKRVEANQLSKKLAEEQVKAETEKFNLGLSTNFQVLQFQRDYENASLSEVNALIDYIKSQNDIFEVSGTLAIREGL
ncbi:MAG: TolC family protein [Candidatus Sericytochromatia bacterium]